MAFASRQARGRRRGGITALARSPFLAAFLASVRRIPNQSSDKLCERVKPESIVWIDLFLQCLDGFRHRWRSKDHGCRNRRANIIGCVADAPRGAAVAGAAVPAAAAQQTGRPKRKPCGVCNWARGVVSTAIPILAPLPQIACHVMQAKSVGKLAADGFRSISCTKSHVVRVDRKRRCSA